jgi:hypothetical protein
MSLEQTLDATTRFLSSAALMPQWKAIHEPLADERERLRANRCFCRRSIFQSARACMTYYQWLVTVPQESA